MRYLFSALFLFVISVIAFSFPQEQKTTAKLIVPSDEIPSVNFCDLAKHPNDYNNKIVRVEANYVERRGSSYLYWDACNKDRYQIRVFECPTHNGGVDGGCLDCTQQELDVCIKLHKEFMDVIGQYLRPNKDHSASRVKGVLVGRLIGPDRGPLNLSDYAFDIQKFEKGMVIPDNAPW